MPEAPPEGARGWFRTSHRDREAMRGECRRRPHAERRQQHQHPRSGNPQAFRKQPSGPGLRAAVGRAGHSVPAQEYRKAMRPSQDCRPASSTNGRLTTVRLAHDWRPSPGETDCPVWVATRQPALGTARPRYGRRTATGEVQSWERENPGLSP